MKAVRLASIKRGIDNRKWGTTEALSSAALSSARFSSFPARDYPQLPSLPRWRSERGKGSPDAAIISTVAAGAPSFATLIAGYRARIVAAVMALFTIATAFHSNLADQNEFPHFFKNIAIAGGLLHVVAFGAGRLSLDAHRR
ncbi:DoxX family protein [Mesorhizobium sp. B2-3-5]|nr:DoxX family protein [Mesorhizobium sp. B2-3-5]